MQQYADIYLLQSHNTGTATSLQRGLQATLEGSRCTCTGGCGYSF